ncbi:MAG: 50S ribosomal protein L32 [Parachlamydiaceae bacterium]|nr:50S ribosomal protein L32 [Parachlamydiaceae bacterium]
MAVPRNRHSNARKNSKRSHHAKKPAHVSTCDNCSNVRLPHTICPSCGAYGDRIVLAKKD